ncbi:MAG: UDP-2,3-diacylglucosamine diphosphatase [Muribaculaceae bacterium]|nr:UDP-2,3-diacylglucosamine diphosphatase [Muribaculaceae bacterium]
MAKPVYFISDLHLGATYLDSPLDYEKRVVNWLRSIENDVSELYLLGDILDYWYEYHDVVPRGFVRFFGQIASMADRGVKITWFIGNHDIWIFDYLPRELGVEVVDGSRVVEILGSRFFLAHGDALGKLPLGFRMMRSIFRNKFCQFLFSAVHPRWTVPFAHRWSSHSRNYTAEKPVFAGPDKEPFVAFAEDYQRHHASQPVDYFVLGHRHIMLDYKLDAHGRLIVLGDWIHHFSYGKWDGKNFVLAQISDKMNVKI